MMDNKVLVTGGSGFIASHLIDQLLAGGENVNTTVRALHHEKKVAPLRLLQQKYPQRLHIYEADLLKEGSFDKAMADCTVVYHVASPFMLPEKIKDAQHQMLEPALHGTRNVLAGVNRVASVRRVVLTSTVGAIFGDYSDVLAMKHQTLAEEYFNTSSTLSHNPYHYSKVMAEREAWKICTAQDRWSMVSINPGLVLGPSLTPASESGSLFLLDEMLKGKFFYGMPDMGVTTVDVREVAHAHIQAAKQPQAHGRYILASRHMITFLEMAALLRAAHPHPYLLPSRQIPKGVISLIGPLFGLSRQYIRNHIGVRFEVDNQRSIDELSVNYRPIQETLIDHYRSWQQQRNA
jgi:nucleoside-diphosphate-sugar epimerase